MTDEEEMNREKFSDMKEAYALGALTPDELREFELYLAEHPEFQPEVDELAGLATLLAISPDDREPPKSLRKNLMQKIHNETGGNRATSATSRRGFGSYLESLVDALRARPLALGAAGLAVVGLLSWNVVLQGQLQSLRGENSNLAAQAESSSAPDGNTSQVLAMAGEGDMSGVEAEVVSYKGGRAVLVAHNVPQIPEGETFQIWVINNGEASPSGLFEPQNGGEGVTVAAYVDHSIEGADAIAVTVEPEGGSEQPTSDPELQASL